MITEGSRFTPTRDGQLLFCCRRKLILAVGSVCVAVLFGCGKDDPFERAVVSGKVTYDGSPVKSGRIRLQPTAETRTPSAAAYIVDGTYRIDHRGGVPEGSYRVIIEGFSGAPSLESNTSSADHRPLADEELQNLSSQRQYIPAKYNSKTELTIQIDANQGELAKNWELEP
ncbi:MAG: hypothetical protein WD468_11775 [Pirellulales bacterium]